MSELSGPNPLPCGRGSVLYGRGSILWRLVVLVPLAAAVCAAQSTAAAKPKPAAPKAAARTLRVPLTTSVAPALKREDFTVRVNGTDAQVTRLRGPGDDLLLLFVFDVAGDLAPVAAAKQAVVERLASLPGNVFVSVMRANDGLQVTLDPTGDREATAVAVHNIPVGGKAAFLDSVQAAAELADSVSARSGVRTAVVYITDSYVGNYREDFTNPVINESDYRDLSRRFPEGLIREKIQRLSESLAAAQAPIFFVHLQQRSDRLSEAYQTGMTGLAIASGGSGIFCRSTVEVPDAVQRIIDSAGSHYLAWVQVPAKVRSNVMVELEAPGRLSTFRNRVVLK